MDSTEATEVKKIGRLPRRTVALSQGELVRMT
jgi:hypothetical protein